ncbi:MAG TPA: hypothetical protein PKJ04_01995 [Nitrospira sp.]|jgi:hypothetical protein|nr:hypothetical protein [Nitrospira sp.]MCC7472478.1 hypothetical protein [Candidatus Nomurabacteria bacterium]MBS0160811.1 hypothetical protein [Nitrospira sp.]MBS0163626.1 hypothetical protein [Nitrospira sp.]MBS0173080.1 hypothetical protein [Nitrospira sp.]
MEPTATQCQFCWRIHDQGTGGGEAGGWSDLPTFIQKHNLATHDLSFTDGYCPQCTQLYCRLTQVHPYDS